MNFTEEDYINAHTFCSNNKDQIKEANLCGCIYCLNIYYNDEVVEYTDDDNTAICPRCGVDAVLPDSVGFLVTDEFLNEMKNYWC